MFSLLSTHYPKRGNHGLALSLGAALIVKPEADIRGDNKSI